MLFLSRLCARVLTDIIVHTRRAIQWYRRAADKGDKRAAQRLKGPQNTAIVAPGGPGSVLHRNENGSGDLSVAGSGKGAKDKDCVIM